MAKTLWADVYFDNEPAGILKEEPGGRITFQYYEPWIEAGKPAISWTLPVRREPFTPARGLPTYFDNLVAEGWLADAQARALKTTRDNRLALLIGFGLDCIGAITIVDPEPDPSVSLDWGDSEQVMALASRASLSGVQPKMTVVREGKTFRATRLGEVSTHIAKLPSPALPDLLENERLTLAACQALLRGDMVVEAELITMEDSKTPTLVISRFDRIQQGGTIHKRHFEEFNQFLGRTSPEKYNGGYEEMAVFMQQSGHCLMVEVDRLMRRVLACILTGNTDAHFKNFAMFHTPEGFRLTPAYDLVAAAIYPPYQTLALSIAGASDLRIGDLKSKNLLALAQSFGLSEAALRLAAQDLEKTLPKALEAVEACPGVSNKLKHKLTEFMEKRWNGTFKTLTRKTPIR